MDTEKEPLAGLRVIDFSGIISGGFATAQLADFGADVVTIEHPRKTDPLREWPPFDEGKSLWWKSIARNKRCITLDLSTDKGQTLALDLIKDADIAFENFRPGTMERWGLGPEELHEHNPSLILVRLSGYGQTGPQSDKPGFGTVAEGISGWAQMNGFSDREPLLPPISLADLTAAQFAVHGAMFALYERDLGSGDGMGQVIDVSLYEPLFRLFVSMVESYDQLGRVPERTGNRHENTSPRGTYETKDGYMTLSASSQRIFENVAQAIGRPELIDDDRFKTNELRVENANELDQIIEEWTSQHSTEDAITTMEENGAIVGPVYDISDIYDDEHYKARNDIVEVDDDVFGSLKTAAPIPKFSRTPGSINHMGVPAGHHNEDVYMGELQVNKEEFDRLVEEEVI